MNPFFLILIALLALCTFPSCTVVRGDQTKGTYTMASVGGNLEGYRQSATEVSAGKIDNATTATKVVSAYQILGVSKVAADVTKNLTNKTTSVLQSKEVTTRAANAGAVDVEKTKIGADLARDTFVPPTE